MKRSVVRRARTCAVVTVGALVLSMFGATAAHAAGNAEMSVSVTDYQDRVGPSTSLTYYSQVANNGPDAAHHVVLTQHLPAGATFDGAGTNDEADTCNEAAGVVTCEIATLGAYSSTSVWVSVTTPATAGTLTTTSSVSADEADTYADDNTSVDTTEVGGVDVSASIGASENEVLRGANVTYTASATNEGFETAAAGTLVVTLPAGATYVSHTVTSGTATCSASPSVVTCTTDAMGPWDPTTVEVVATVPNVGGTITASADVTTGSTDYDPSNDHTTADVQVVVGLPTAISNGTISLGINPSGELNAAGVGVLDERTGNDGIIPGCPCEGWGAGDAATQIRGYANQSAGSSGYEVEDFVVDADSAVSTVAIPSHAEPTMRVVHDYHPSANPDLYEATVTITNTSSATIQPRYRRAMDWDIPPTTFDELVTIQGSESAANVLYASDNGFATSDPFAGPSSIQFEGDAVDSGPADHGALFDFGFPALAPAASLTFKIYYGSAPTEAAALSDLAGIDAEVYSLGQPSDEAGAARGEPNTFMFAFTGVGGPPVLGNQVSIGNASAYEGDVPGTRSIKFPVTLTKPATSTVTVDYVITPGTASGGKTGDINDKKGKTGKITFKPTKTGLTPVTKFVTVPINPDIAVEGDETFTVTLSNPTGGVSLGDGVGTGTVLNDDAGTGQRIGIGSVDVYEGDAGKAKVTAMITLARPATGSERVTVSTGGGTAIPGTDYKPLTKTIALKAGQRSVAVNLQLYPDLVADGNRTIQLNLSSIVGASLIGSSSTLITVIDDD